MFIPRGCHVAQIAFFMFPATLLSHLALILAYVARLRPTCTHICCISVCLSTGLFPELIFTKGSLQKDPCCFPRCIFHVSNSYPQRNLAGRQQPHIRLDVDASLSSLLTVPSRVKLAQLSHAIQGNLQDSASTFRVRGRSRKRATAAVLWPIIVPLQKFVRDPEGGEGRGGNVRSGKD